MKEFAALIYDHSPHYLDHLAPLCSLLDIPLIICEPPIYEHALTYYPDLSVIESSVFEIQLPKNLITCDNIPLLQAAFPHQTSNIFWLPHGNSDKGLKGPFFEGIGDKAFVYGQKMVDFMHKKKAYPKTFRIGNFRYHYFLKHQAFYEKLIDLPQGKNILYAPTWEEGIVEKPLPQIDSTSNLFIKFHPNTVEKYRAEIEILQGKTTQPNIYFLPNICPIYPILHQCSSYIDNISSISYDFLTFQPEKQDLYHYTFDPTPNWAALKSEILCAP